jgi:DNA replication and repair protein RecF
MPVLSSITLTQFKNYSYNSYDFNAPIIGICGLNGVGKTNLLDAIYYLCFTKSYFNNSDNLHVKFNTDGFRLSAVFDNNNIVCINKQGGKKEFWCNEVQYDKFSNHIGKYPAVMIAPDDVDLITGGSESRRKFIDTTISQIDATYLQQLIVYNKVLQQRNSLLKRFAEYGQKDVALLEVIDQQLMQAGKIIYATRKEYASELVPLVQQFYQQIADSSEVVEVIYQSQLHNSSFENLLLQNREKDYILQRSNGGIHKDEIGFQLNEQPFKNIASQGQRKSLLFALKLAEFEQLKKHKNITPTLLLDDIFEKLDMQRMHNLLHWVCVQNKGQVFITDTHKDRLTAALTALDCSFQIIELENSYN